jgi:hypothetical protein
MVEVVNLEIRRWYRAFIPLPKSGFDYTNIVKCADDFFLNKTPLSPSSADFNQISSVWSKRRIVAGYLPFMVSTSTCYHIEGLLTHFLLLRVFFKP